MTLPTPAAAIARFVNLMSRSGVERRLAHLGVEVIRLTEPVSREADRAGAVGGGL